MKKAFLFLILFFGLLPVNQVWSQISSYQTYYSELTCINTTPGFGGQITIGFYPNKAVSYHESNFSGIKRGILTVNNNATDGYYYELPLDIFIRDMEQYKLSMSVFFCGTKYDYSAPNPDSVGIIGYFTLDGDGIITNFCYFEVPEVKVINKLITYPLDGTARIAAIGKKTTGTTIDYFFIYVDDIINHSYSYSMFFPVNGIKYTPVEIVCSDDYVCVVSYEVGSTDLYLRRFKKTDIWNIMNYNLYKYTMPEPITHTPKATFMGEKILENGENDMGIIYLSQSTTNIWSAHFKVIDLSTMNMKLAQKQQNFAEKNEIAGLTYLVDSRKVAVLELYDPALIMNNSVIMIFDPDKTVNYTTEYYYKTGIWFYSIDRLYKNFQYVNHFIVGNTSIPISRWWLQTYVTIGNDCMDVRNTDIQIQQITPPIVLTSTLYRYDNISSPIIPTLNRLLLKPSTHCPLD